MLNVSLQFVVASSNLFSYITSSHFENERWVLTGVEWVHCLFLFPLDFRGNVVVTCRIGSFLCSLDNLLQKNVMVFFFENQILKWRSFENRGIFELLFTFFSYQWKVTKIPFAHISLTYIYVFCSRYWLSFFFFFFFFCLTNFEKNTKLSGLVNFSLVWFLVLILIRAILEQSINRALRMQRFYLTFCDIFTCYSFVLLIFQ